MEQIPALLEQYPQPAWLITTFIFLMLIKQALGLLRENISAFRKLKGAVHCEPKNIEAMARAEAEASKEMNAIAMEYGVDRVGISLFHNGIYSINNVHFLRVSVIAEGLSGRVGPILPVSQQRLAAEYGDLGDRIIVQKERICVPDIEAIRESLPAFADFLQIHFVKSLYLVPLFADQDGKRVVDGCLFVHYCVESKTMTADELDGIQERAQAVYNELSKANKGEDDV